jgi:hypothetical protein
VPHVTVPPVSLGTPSRAKLFHEEPEAGNLPAEGDAVGVQRTGSWGTDFYGPAATATSASRDCSAIAGCRKQRAWLVLDAQAIFFRRRHQPRRPPLAKADSTGRDTIPTGVVVRFM